MKKIVVIGGGAAGAKAASKAKRLNPNNQVELYTKTSEIAYSLCGLPYFIEGSVKKIEDLIIRTPQDFEKNGINIFLNHEASEIFPEKNCILINNNHIFYDELILALGANINLPNIKNLNAKNVFSLRSLESGKLIKEKMKESKNVLIIGAGYIAIELIEAFTKNNFNVILLEKKERIASDFDEDFSEHIQKMIDYKTKGQLQCHYNENVIEFLTDENNSFKGAKTESNKEFFADFCILATGAIPNVDIAKNAGIKLGTTGAIEVDSKMRTNYQNIFACGDCAQKYCIITQEPTYIGLGTIANKEGRVAAINADGTNYENFDGVLKSTITRFYDWTISKTGLTMQEAKKYSKDINLEPICSSITKNDKAGYMPDTNKMTIKIVADKRSGEVLGAQGIGWSGNISQRINTITSALKSRLTVEKLLHLDLAYSPPFSSSIDPILTACYQLKELMKK
ncbi:MAG: FAD-dependent oxidoreductase [Candidatus Gastranaerophilales bacterium]|nr:FAD-dependent oxidoreductase [Candidatus Gastranaerophilales bacterium]